MGFRLFFSILISLALPIDARLAVADPPGGGTIGPEFTFRLDESFPQYWMKKGLNKEEAIAKAGNLTELDQVGGKKIDEYVAMIRRLFPSDCVEVDGVDLFRKIKIKRHAFDEKALFELKVTPDQGVIEVGFEEDFKPEGYTLSEIRGFKAELQKATFQAFGNIGLKPDVAGRIGGGHVNLGLDSTFHNDSTLLRNFFADYANHPELAVAFGYRERQAPTSLSWTDQQRRAFSQVLADFDASVAQGKPWSCEELVRAVENRVYKADPRGLSTWQTKLQSICLKTIGTTCSRLSWRVELRAHGPQKSVDELIQQGELYHNRIEFLRAKNSPAQVAARQGQVEWVAYEPRSSMTKDEMAKNYLTYVHESSLGFAPYTDMVRDREMHGAIQELSSGGCPDLGAIVRGL